MNLSTALATFLLLAGDVHAFSVVTRPSTLSSISSALHASDEPSKKKVLRAEDVIAGGKAKGDDAEEAPKLFTPDIYDDFQSALVKLERRVKDGSGTLSAVEVKELVDETDRIVAEMNAFLEDPASAGLNWSGAGGGAPIAITPEVVAPTPVDIPENDDGNDEPAYDPESGGGFGLAAGTRNTYAIEGMDSMSPEEYRAKLQETISGRQAQRRSANLEGPRDLIGNRSSSGYLDALSRGQSGAGGGGGAMYKGEEKKEEKGPR